jgi:uncharacterized protein YjbI with pentapeptide repeats
MQIFNLDGALLYEDQQPLKGANLKSIRLFCPDFESKEMTGIDLSGARLSGASFDSSVLREANFKRAELEGGFLADCQLDNANLSQASLYMVHGFRASFRGADLSNGEFLGCEFSEADFTNANLQGAFFGPSNISHRTRLCQARLRGADLSGTRFEDVVYDESTTFPTGFDPNANGLVKEK